MLRSGAAFYLTALGLFLVRAGFAFALVLISLLGRPETIRRGTPPDERS